MWDEVLAHPVSAMVVMLGVLVLVHELGHYTVGRLCGIGVEVLSVGVGPKLFSISRRGTVYQWALIPLGGYVKFVGAQPGEEPSIPCIGIPFYQAPWTHKLMTLLAGPGANILLAFFVYLILGAHGMEHRASIIGQVNPNGPAALAGLKSGDHIKAVQHVPISMWRELQEAITLSPGKPLVFTVQRDQQMWDLTVTPEAHTDPDSLTSDGTSPVGRIGIMDSALDATLSVPLHDSPAHRMGLRSGMLVDSLKWSSEGETWTKEHPTKTWTDLVYVLAQARTEKALSLSFHVKSFQGKQASFVEEGKHDGQQRAISPETLFVNISLKDYTGTEDWIRWLGLEHASLTVGYLADPSKLDLSKPDPSTEHERLPPSGLQVGDVLRSFQGNPLHSLFDFMEQLQQNHEPQVSFGLYRLGQWVEQTVQLKPIEVQKMAGKDTIYILPVGFMGHTVSSPPVIERYTEVLPLIAYGFRVTVKHTQDMLIGMGRLLTGQLPLKSVGGPMMMAKIAGDSAKMGWDSFLSALALVSLNLAIVNMLPIPVLDGGQSLVVLGEAITRRPLHPKLLEQFYRLGFVAIVALMVLSTYNDLSRFWVSMLEEVQRLWR
jgi:regulator of sigma E protease